MMTSIAAAMIAPSISIGEIFLISRICWKQIRRTIACANRCVRVKSSISLSVAGVATATLGERAGAVTAPAPSAP